MTGQDFTFYTDSGHGWLEVPVQLCIELGLQGKISGYSYRNFDKLYLEEDCDASVFIEAYAKAFNVDPYEFAQSNRRVNHNISPVRSYTGGIPSDLLKAE